MRVMLLAGCAAILLLSVGTATAQSTPPAEPPVNVAPMQFAQAEAEPPNEAEPPEGSDVPPDSPEEDGPPDAREAAPALAPEVPAARRQPRPPGSAAPAAVDRRRACRAEARRLGLRGPDASGHTAICLAEARLACTKEAVARTPDRRSRNDYIRDCMGLPPRRSR